MYRVYLYPGAGYMLDQPIYMNESPDRSDWEEVAKLAKKYNRGEWIDSRDAEHNLEYDTDEDERYTYIDASMIGGPIGYLNVQDVVVEKVDDKDDYSEAMLNRFNRDKDAYDAYKAKQQTKAVKLSQPKMTNAKLTRMSRGY